MAEGGSIEIVIEVNGSHLFLHLGESGLPCMVQGGDLAIHLQMQKLSAIDRQGVEILNHLGEDINGLDDVPIGGLFRIWSGDRSLHSGQGARSLFRKASTTDIHVSIFIDHWWCHNLYRNLHCNGGLTKYHLESSGIILVSRMSCNLSSDEVAGTTVAARHCSRSSSPSVSSSSESAVEGAMSADDGRCVRDNERFEQVPAGAFDQL